MTFIARARQPSLELGPLDGITAQLERPRMYFGHRCSLNLGFAARFAASSPTTPQVGLIRQLGAEIG